MHILRLTNYFYGALRIITESAFKKRFLAKLRKIPNSWWESINQISIIGTPDVIGCINGYFIALEFKRSAKAKIRPMQLLKQKEIQKAGGISLIVMPENEKEIIKLLESYLI